MRLSGNETWVLAGTQGALIWANMWDDDWWPITEVDLDSGLMKIDGCGQLQNIHLSDCSRLRIEYDIIEQDNFYECQYYD